MANLDEKIEALEKRVLELEKIIADREELFSKEQISSHSYWFSDGTIQGLMGCMSMATEPERLRFLDGFHKERMAIIFEDEKAVLVLKDKNEQVCWRSDT
jgi:hypothetical protein